MKNAPVPASSSKQTGKRKLKAVVEDVVVEDVVVEDEFEDDQEEDDGSVGGGTSEDDDYQEEVEEDDPNEVLGGGDYVDEFVEPAQSGRKRKVVEKQVKDVPNTSSSKPVQQQQQKRIYRTVKRPAAVKRQFVERSQRQYVERSSAIEREYVERPSAIERQFVERPRTVQRQYVERSPPVHRPRRRIVVEQDDEIDLEPGPSVGEKVKMKGVVVSTQLRKCGKSANYNCRVSVFCELITILKNDKKKIDLVSSCGFGGLMKLKVKKIDRRFCYWLMTRVDHDRSVLVGVDGQELPLGPEQWRCIFDLPRGPRHVPDVVEDPIMQSKVTDIVRHYGELNASGRENISIQKAYECLGLMPIGTEEEKDNFMRAFLIVVLGCILCPTTNGQSMCTSLLPAVTVGAGAADYDWCSCVHSRLMGSMRDFHKRFDPKGYAAGGGGCALFLMIFYLDHLALPPLSWGTMPRIDVWTEKRFNAAIQADLLPSLDYGKQKFVDVAYGERHPWEPRDSSESLEVRVGKEVLKLMKPYLEKFESILNAANRGFVRNAPKERSPVRLPIERSPILNVSSRSESISEMSGEVSKGRLEETYRQLQEVVVGMNVEDPIGRVVEEVSLAVKEQFGTVGDPDHSQTGEAVPSVVAPSPSAAVVFDVAPREGGLRKMEVLRRCLLEGSHWG